MRRRSAHLAGLVTAILVVACSGQAPGAPTPAATGASPSLAQPSAIATATTPPAPTAIVAQTPVPTPMPTPSTTATASAAPSASPAGGAGSPPLDGVYAAFRPSTLRTVPGATVFTKPAGEIRFAYEMVNRSSDAVVVPFSEAYGRTAAWFGSIQTWIEPLGDADALATCLDGAARKGALYATGGGSAAFAYLSATDSLPAGSGVTRYASLPAERTACFPVGRYRYHVEYKPLEPTGLDDVIAEASLVFEISEPLLVATLGDEGIAGTATLAGAASGGTASSSVTLRGLARGAAVRSVVRVGDCGTAGVIVVTPPPFSATLGGTYRERWQFTVPSAARRAISAGSSLAIRVTVDGAATCAVYAPASPDAGANRPPTAWSSPVLTERAANGWTVRASAETFLGSPAQAVDGSVDRTWNSGGWPSAWIEIDFGRSSRVTAVRLLPSQLPNVAPTVHRVYGRPDHGTSETLLASLEGVTTDNAWITVPLAAPVSIRYLRIETVTSPSWVAWREIDVTGPLAKPVSLMPFGTHDGSLDAIGVGDRCYANGWASDPDDRSLTVTVRILADGKAIWTGPADTFRQDLLDAGIGDGTAGFWVDLRGLVSLGVEHRISAQARDAATGRWVDLNLTPRFLTCR